MPEVQKMDRTELGGIGSMLEKEAKRRPDLIASLILKWLEEDGTINEQKEALDKKREPPMKKLKQK